MKRDRFRHTMHGEVAKNIAALRTSSLHTPALEGHIRKLFHVKEFRAAQMIVPLFDARIDAAHLDLCRDRRILRMLAVDFDPAAEIGEFAMSRSEELMHTETNGRAGRIELVGLFCRHGGAQARKADRSKNIW